MRGWPRSPSAPCSTGCISAKVPAGTTAVCGSATCTTIVSCDTARRRRGHGRDLTRRRTVRPGLVGRRPPAGGGHGDPAAPPTSSPTASVVGARRPLARRARFAQRHDRGAPMAPRTSATWVRGSTSSAPNDVAGQTFRVEPDGTWECAADDLRSPNGHILTDDGRTLIVAESGGLRLTAFTVAPTARCTDRRIFAELAARADDVAFAPPDGICLDAEGAVWVADPIGARVFRVRRRRRGHRLDRLRPTPSRSRACSAAPTDARCSCAQPPIGSATRSRAVVPGRIDACEVDVPGAGRP